MGSLDYLRIFHKYYFNHTYVSFFKKGVLQGVVLYPYFFYKSSPNCTLTEVSFVNFNIEKLYDYS